MRFMRTFFILWVSLLIFVGCAPKSYKVNDSRLIIIKSQKLRFADLGYLRSNEDEVRLDLFITGKLVQSIEIDTFVCVQEGCMSKSTFNEDYLHKAYPEDLLLNVLLGRPIFQKTSFEKTSGGFRQELKTSDYNIVYKVENGEISFKDKQNKLTLKILMI